MTATLTLGSTTCRPTFSTPRDERFPTLGPAVGEVARRLGRPLMPWQQELADVAFEYDPANAGRFRYDEIDTTVPRQSGKTTLTLAKKVFRLTVLARQYGPQRSLYTAQTRVKARAKLEMDFSELLRASRSFREVPHSRARPQRPTDWRLSLNNGSEHLQFGSSNYLQIDAPSRTGGHGDTLDDGDIDEAFSQEDDTVEAGIRPTMATRKNAQLWVTSTAGDRRSTYLWRKVLAGRAATEAGQHGRVCYTEYSAPEDAEPGDPATWWACMPALGITIPEDFIRGEWERAQRKGSQGIDSFRRAYLNQWPEVPILGDDDHPGAFPADRWKALIDTQPSIGAPSFGVATNPDRTWTAIAAAWRRTDGAIQLLIGDDYRPDAVWVGARGAELRSKYGGTVMESTAAKGLVHGAEQPSEAEQGLAENALYDLVLAGGIRHGNERALNAAVRGGHWKLSGNTRRLDQKGSLDISPLIAAALAVRGVMTVSGGWMVGV